MPCLYRPDLLNTASAQQQPNIVLIMSDRPAMWAYQKAFIRTDDAASLRQQPQRSR